VNNQGRLDAPNAIGLHRFSPATEYFDLLAGWRAAGRFEGLRFGPAEAAPGSAAFRDTDTTARSA
jgi:hypothetical protein